LGQEEEMAELAAMLPYRDAAAAEDAVGGCS